MFVTCSSYIFHSVSILEWPLRGQVVQVRGHSTPFTVTHEVAEPLAQNGCFDDYQTAYS